MTTSAVGRAGVGEGEGQNILDNLVGGSNQSEVIVQGQEFNALIDTGSMVTTIAESAYHSLNHKPVLHSLDDLGFNLSIADGSYLKYIGYTECDIEVPSLDGFKVTIPVLVVPNNDLTSHYQVIVGTNIIRLFRNSDAVEVLPEAWQMAVNSFSSNEFVVRSLNKRNIQIAPYESKVIHGMSTVSEHVSEVLTENLSDDSNYIVCPRVVKLDQRGKRVKIPVKICNITARPITVKPRSLICSASQVKVVDNLASDMGDSQTRSKLSVDDLDVKIDMQNLTMSELDQVHDMLDSWRHVFSSSPLDIGETDAVSHTIELEDERPFKQPYRRIPPGMYDEVRQHVKEMLDIGVIRESNSPYSSNVVLVRKHDGSLRFCIDYRMLNARTRKDAYMLPRFDDVVDNLSGAQYFSKLDLRSGYWQVPLAEKDKAKTAFSVGNLGFYECNRMGFGLTNAPATFQRLMEKCMGDMHLRECLIFLDDILIFSNTFDEHITRLESVFKRLQDHKLKLKPSKCELFKSSVTYLGHVVSKEGIHTDPEKLSAVRDWPNPNNVKELRQFLGFAGYYRRFVRNYSQIMKPLNALLEGHGTAKGSKRSRSKQAATWHWGKEQEIAFYTFKQKLQEPPVLTYADYSLPFIVHTDASSAGLGAVLYQKQDGVERVIAYASRGLRPSEKNYPAHRLEFLALKWAITDKFHDYLYGNTFEVVIDNNPLTYILSKAKLDATSHRWVNELANYTFTISYRSGKLNSDADGLSRRPQLFSEMVKAISLSAVTCVPLVDSLSDNPCSSFTDSDFPSENMSGVDWVTEQRQDSTLARVIELWENGFHPRGGGGDAVQRQLKYRSF